MATEKGHFRDDIDRFSPRHQEMCFWLLQNADRFVRQCFFDRPTNGVIVTLERLMANKGYIIGFADAILEYQIDATQQERVLVEVKSRLKDLSACLRQLRTYNEYIPGVTKMCVLHDDEDFRPEFKAVISLNDLSSGRWAAEDSMRAFFGSQNMYVADFKHEGHHNLNFCRLPSGRRHMSICEAREEYGRLHVTLRGLGLNPDRAHDEEGEFHVFLRLDSAPQFATLIKYSKELRAGDGLSFDTATIAGTEILLEVQHFVTGETNSVVCGYVAEREVALYRPDLSYAVAIPEWPADHPAVIAACREARARRPRAISPGVLG